MTPSPRFAGFVRTVSFAILLLASPAVGVSTAAAQATLQSDKTDYYPGEIAVLTGSGFTPGEDVAIRVGHNDATPDSGEAHASWSLTADENGAFTTEWVVCGDDCLGSSLLATADGQTSGLHAEVVFTDSPKVGSVVLGPQVGSLCSGTAGSVTYTVTVKRGTGSGSNGNFTATLLPAGLPGTVTAVFTPNPIQVPSQADSASGTLTLTSTDATPGAVTAFHVRASTSASDTAGTNATLTINQGPAITCPANITLANTAGLCARNNVTYTATATGSPAPTITFSPASGSTFPVGTTTVTATATNSCGSSSCTFTVTINDTENPALTPPANIVANNAPGQCGAVVSFTPTATDNCPGVTVTSSPASGSTFPVGTTTVNVTATDAHGHSATGSFTVTVNDTEKPALTVPADIAVNNDPDVCGAVVTFTTSATDNCPGVGTVTSTPASGSTFPVGTTTVTSAVTDAHGNTTTKTFTVTVNDTENPALTVPTNIVQANDSGACGAVVTFAPTATDNCPGVTVTSTPASGSTFPVGTTTVNVTATDAHGHSSTGSFTVTVNDTEKPVLTIPADITVSNDPGICGAIVSFTTTATDNCPGVGLVTSTPASGSTFPVGTTLVTSTVTDAHGNTQTSTFQVTVNDTEKPTLTVPANITVSNDPGQCGAAVSFTVTAADNCPGVTVSGPASGSFFPTGTTTVTVTATDAHGSATTKSFTVTVNDTEKPHLTVPADITVSNDAGVCGAVVTFTTSATDNCGGVGSITSTPPSGSTFPVGTTTVTSTVMDFSGNTTTDTFQVTVNDTEKPELTVPADITVSNDGGVCSTVVTFTTSATDNCGGVGSITSTPPSGSTFPVGTTLVTSTVTDAHGNTQTSTFQVTVNDTEKPTLTVPANITVSNDPGQCGAAVSFTVTAADNCPGVTVSGPASGTFFPTGTTTVTLTATDAHGNATTKSFTVTVNDTEKPHLTVPADITVNNDAGVCGAVVTFTTSATDNCGGVGSITSTPPSGSTLPVGTTLVTSTVMDFSGNTTTETFQVTVNDIEKPALTVPADITVSNDPGICGAAVNFTTTATDNCPDVTVLSTPPSGSTFPVGTTTVTVTATDAHGNPTTKTFQVTVNDTEKPTLTVPVSITVGNDPGLCGAAVDFTVTATDNCPGVTVSGPASGSFFPTGTTTVTLTATDAHGNATSKSFTVTVNDTEKPHLTVPADITVNNDAGVCGAVVTFTTSATDNCGGVGPITSTPPSGSTFPVGTTTVTSTVMDFSGNTTTETFQVTVNDTEKPELTVPADITVSNDAGLCGAVVNFTTTATDNCPDVTMLSTPPSGSTFPVGTTTVTVTATDAHGNPTTSTFQVTVNDSEKPVITTAAIVASTDHGICTAAVTLGTTATDNCPGVTLNGVRSDGAPLASPFPKGITTIAWTAADAHGNGATSSQTVTVNDHEQPTITPPAAVNAQTGPTATICGLLIPDALLGSPVADDNCSVTVTRTGIPAGNIFPVGSTTVTYTADDGNGNTAAATQVVTVLDKTPPVLTAPAAVNAVTGAGATICGKVIADAVLGTATYSDNCSATLSRTGVPSGNAFPVGVTTITYTATDPTGNATVRTQTVTVTDNTPPVIASANLSVPTDAGLCSATIASLGTTRTDNCGGTVTLTGTRSDGQPLASPYPKGTTTVTWLATDANGNTASAAQTVTVNNPAPSAAITAPASGFIVGAGQTVTFAGTFSDNAGDTHTVQWSCDATTFAGTVNEGAGTTAGSVTFGTAGVYSVKMTVKDQCNQSAVATQVGGAEAMIVVYDPSAGFVTGGGWISSLAGAYVPNATMTGKATFGFVAKYKKGASAPDGETEFQFTTGSLNFHSTVYEWLVVAGTRAQYKGSGTINGAGDYQFILSALDGDLKGGGGLDKFRMKITNKTTGASVYDNQLGAPDSSAASTVIGGGSIVIHTDRGFLGADAPDAMSAPPARTALEPNVPNPFNPSTTLTFHLAESGRSALRIYNVHGQLVRTLQEGWMPAGTYRAAWDGTDQRGRAVSSGSYYAVILNGNGIRDRIRMVLLK